VQLLLVCASFHDQNPLHPAKLCFIEMSFLISEDSIGIGIGLILSLIFLQYFKLDPKRTADSSTQVMKVISKKIVFSVERIPRFIPRPVNQPPCKLYVNSNVEESVDRLRTPEITDDRKARTGNDWERMSRVPNEEVDPACREPFSLKSSFVLLFADKLKDRYRQVKERRRRKSNPELTREGVTLRKSSVHSL
jgi:hypothetical protein